MNGTNGNQPGYPENALVPYPVIVAATKGDPDAMKIVLQHFSGYIARLSMRKLYDERGNVYFGVRPRHSGTAASQTDDGCPQF